MRGSRYTARCAAGSVIMPADHRVNPEKNHRLAAELLRTKLGWDAAHYGMLASGCLDDGSYAHVFVDMEHVG